MSRYAEIYAVIPSGHGTTLHLKSPGYRPGVKRRAIADLVSLCGVVVARARFVPLRDGLDLRPTGTDPRAAWSWCKSCLGHAVALVGLDAHVVREVAEKTLMPDDDPIGALRPAQGQEPTN